MFQLRVFLHETVLDLGISAREIVMNGYLAFRHTFSFFLNPFLELRSPLSFYSLCNPNVSGHLLLSGLIKQANI